MATHVTDVQTSVLQGTPARTVEKTRIRVERPDLRTRLKHEGPLLVLCIATLALSFAIPALKSRHAWINLPCLFHMATRLPCPTCGLTRSFILTAHGNFTGALKMHLLGPALFFLVALCGVYLGSSLVGGYRIKLALTPLARRTAFYSVLAVFLVCWVIKLVFIGGPW